MEQLGAGCRWEGLQALLQIPLELIEAHGRSRAAFSVES